MTTAIRPSTAYRTPELERLLRSDRPFNYFIRTGIESEKLVFSEVFAEESPAGVVVGALFRRTSGTLRFDSEIAKRLYESMGYEPVGRVAYLNARR